jgi:hypothetical protein
LRGPRRLPCGLGGTGLPLLQGSHLGVPGGEQLLECEHCLLQLLCRACLGRCPCNCSLLRVGMPWVASTCPNTLEVSLQWQSILPFDYAARLELGHDNSHTHPHTWRIVTHVFHAHATPRPPCLYTQRPHTTKQCTRARRRPVSASCLEPRASCD